MTKQLGKAALQRDRDRAKPIERSDSRADGDGDADSELNSSCRHWKKPVGRAGKRTAPPHR